jgi:hypothetical protein
MATRSGVRVSEKTVQRHIVQALEAVGGKVYKIGTTRRRGDHPGTMQTPGLPDLLAFLPIRDVRMVARWQLLVVEVKAAGGRLRHEQAEFRAFCLGANVAYVTGDLDDVLRQLQAEGYLKVDRRLA